MQETPTLREQFKLGVAHLKAQRYEDAQATYRLMLAQQPNLPEVHHNLGMALKGQRRLEEAVASFRNALTLRPDFPEAYHNLGETLREWNKPGEAAAAQRQAVQQRPEFVSAWISLAVALVALQRPAEALDAANRATALRPDSAQAHWIRGVALGILKRSDEAIAAYQRALALNPVYLEALNNLGTALCDAFRPAEGIDCFRRALARREAFLAAWTNLGLALRDVGQIEEGLACFDKGMQCEPGGAPDHSSRLFILGFHPGFDDAAIFRETRKWNEQFARPFAARIARHENDPTPQRRLRIGYLSPDFRNHCQSLFTLPLLSHHDRRAFEIFCYSNVGNPDDVTRKLKRHVDHWTDISRLSDDAAAQAIRRDRIDLLVDLTLHMGNNRMLVFARKPAPVQVTWLGYPGTTGLDAMDYRVTDPWLDPVESEIRNPKSEIRINDQMPNDQNPNESDSQSASKPPGSLPHSDIGKLTSASSVESGFDSDFGFRISDFSTKEPCYSERSIRLPHTFWCYDPRGIETDDTYLMPTPVPLPALSAGHVTFGCLNNFCKVTQPTLKLWAGVLAAVPEGRLILLAPPGPHRQQVVQKLGVAPERVSFVAYQPRRQYLQTYQQIDLCLDTLPANGHTTSLDALWMGVPVVTIVGGTILGRAGWSQMNNLGLTELVARSEEQFAEIAVKLAGDLKRLGELRATLRGRMEQSPLMDGQRFARNMESAYRQMWHAWCDARGRKDPALTGI